MSQKNNILDNSFSSINNFTFSFLNVIANPIVIVNSDTSIEYVNPAAEIRTGYSKSELVGHKPPYPYWPEIKRQDYAQEFAGGMPPLGRRECLFQNKNGQPFWIEMTSAPIPAEGKSKYILTSWIDITTHIITEEKLRRSEERFRLLAENGKDLIYRIRLKPKLEFDFISASIKTIVGDTPDDYYADPEFGLKKVHPDDWPVFRGLSRSSANYNKPISFRYICKDGSIVWFELMSIPICDDKGDVIALEGIARDITERKQREAETLEIETLKRLNQAKSELLANVSHELRTPLASIKGFIETLIEPDVEWNRNQRLDFLLSADRETDHLTKLIKDLLDMSRIESGKLSLEKCRCTLNQIIEFCQPVLNTLAAKHKLKITIPADSPGLLADKLRIAQVIINLVENATKFSPAGSLISIGAQNQMKDLIISVSDRGIGMTHETIKNLFNRFYQAERVVSGKTRGNGLGLAICKGIVEAHQGKIWVESLPGKGSTFYFNLPWENNVDLIPGVNINGGIKI